MAYDQYGRPMMGGYGDSTTANLRQPNMQSLGGSGPVPWIRFPFYPTAPFYSTDPRVGTQVRMYGATLLNTDADYVVGTEAIRTVQFDIPCRMVAINGAAVVLAAGVPQAAAFTGMNPLDSFLFRIEYTTGDRLMTGARMASTVLGSMENPGEIGGTGYTIDQGASLILGITPLMANLRVDITLICLEIRGATNFSKG